MLCFLCRWLTQDDGDGKCEVTLKPKPMPKESSKFYMSKEM